MDDQHRDDVDQTRLLLRVLGQSLLGSLLVSAAPVLLWLQLTDGTPLLLKLSVAALIAWLLTPLVLLMRRKRSRVVELITESDAPAVLRSFRWHPIMLKRGEVFEPHVVPRLKSTAMHHRGRRPHVTARASHGSRPGHRRSRTTSRAGPDDPSDPEPAGPSRSRPANHAYGLLTPEARGLLANEWEAAT